MPYINVCSPVGRLWARPVQRYREIRQDGGSAWAYLFLLLNSLKKRWGCPAENLSVRLGKKSAARNFYKVRLHKKFMPPGGDVFAVRLRRKPAVCSARRRLLKNNLEKIAPERGNFANFATMAVSISYFDIYKKSIQR